MVMNFKRMIVALATVAGVWGMLTVGESALSGEAVAQRVCTEGRTVSGSCVNPALAAIQRRRAIVFSQPKFSISVPTALVPPRDDRLFPLPRDYREFNRGLFSTNPFPYSCHPNC